MLTEIPVVVEATSETKSMVKKSMDVMVTSMDVNRMKSNLEEMIKTLEHLIDLGAQKGGIKLKEVEVGLEITAEGGVNLIGTMTAGAKAALKLTFERS